MKKKKKKRKSQKEEAEEEEEYLKTHKTAGAKRYKTLEGTYV